MRMTARSRLLIGLAVASSTTAACVSSRTVDSPFRSGQSEGDQVMLTVQNHNYQDATIYAYWNGVRDRVGMVIGKTEETFSMRWRSEEIQLEVDFVGGGGYFTEIVSVYRGDHLEFRIPVNR